MDFEALMKIVQERDIGALAIKAIAKSNWEEQYQSLDRNERPYTTWYKPFETAEAIGNAISFALSVGFSTAVTASDVNLVALTLDAEEKIHELSAGERDDLLREAQSYKLLEFTF